MPTNASLTNLVLAFGPDANPYVPELAERHNWTYVKQGKLRSSSPVGDAGYTVIVSFSDNIEDQIKDAEQFFASYGPELQQLCCNRDLQNPKLAFGLLSDDVAFRNAVNFSPTFLALLGKLRIELAVVWYLSWEQWKQREEENR